MAHKLDLAALAALRPRVSAAVLNVILDRAQRGTVRPGKMFFGEQEGFLARVDVAGNIGSVTFASGFPSELAVEGLHVGMTLAAARAERPQLRHHRDETHGEITIGQWVEILPEGFRLQLNIRDGKVLSIKIEQPDAVYRRPPPAYPQPQQTPGAPFADPNLKLVVLDALREAGVVDLGQPDDLARHLMGDSYNRERDGYHLLRPVYDYLVRYPLDAKQFDAVTTLTFDGGSDIYPYMYPFWDGEDGVFDVASLDGIERLRNLARFNVIALLRDTDLAHLRPLRRLRTISLDPGRYENAEVLLTFPALRELHLYGSLPDPRIARALAARGVKITTYG